MVQVNEMQFATSIGVLFALKESYGCKTLQETYKIFEASDMDTLLEILKVSYNKQNGTSLTVDEFIEEAGKHHVGFMRLAEIFQEVVEKIMFDGMTPEQVAERKKFLAQKTM